jgi:cytochrome c5
MRRLLRQLVPIAAAAVVAVVAYAAHAEDRLALKSESVDLPDSDRTFPDGPGAEAVNDNCLACHSAGMVLTQPALSAAEWRAIVEKMRTTYKAPVDPGDVDKIVGYLAKLRDK